jgi:hypothetical protein
LRAEGAGSSALPQRRGEAENPDAMAAADSAAGREKRNVNAMITSGHVDDLILIFWISFIEC